MTPSVQCVPSMSQNLFEESHQKQLVYIILDPGKMPPVPQPPNLAKVLAVPVPSKAGLSLAPAFFANSK